MALRKAINAGISTEYAQFRGGYVRSPEELNATRHFVLAFT
jgi:hypothetical protein